MKANPPRPRQRHDCGGEHVWLCFRSDGVVDLFHDDLDDPIALLPRFARVLRELIENPSAMRCALGIHDGAPASREAALAAIGRLATLSDVVRIEAMLAIEKLDDPDLYMEVRAALQARRRILEGR